jgi:hypothetical protein
MTKPTDIEVSFGVAPGVSFIFPPVEAFDLDVTTPEGHVIDSTELAPISGQALDGIA